MKKQLLLIIALSLSALTYSQATATIDSAPASLEQAEVFTVTTSFDTDGDTVDGNLTFILRLYDTSDESFTWVAASNSNQNGVASATGVVSPNITVPPSTTSTANLAAGLEYRIAVSYKRTTAQDFISALQAVTITDAVVPTISYSSLPAEISADTGATNYAYGNLAYEVTWADVTPGQTLFNQLKDSNGTQIGGFSFAVTTANGSQVITWNFFGGGTLVAGTNAQIASQYAGAANISNLTIPIVATVLGTSDFNIINVSVFPNPTTDKITIETKQEFGLVNIFDITGKTVKAFDNKKTLNVTDLNKGIYFLKTDTGLTAKFIKN